MKYLVSEVFKVRTSQRGEIELLPGQIVTLPKEIAFKLVERGKITPTDEGAAYKVYSEILGCSLWIVDTDMKEIRVSEGTTEPIYTADEIRKLKGMNKEGLKAVHMVKEIFEDSKVENIRRKENPAKW
ncbi:MAG: hypothetical protein ABSA46_01605 [Thermodesulfovibrionales bacterium]|jgi:hypothetical protein